MEKDDSRSEQAQLLTEKGFRFLAEKEFGQALETAKQLEDIRHTSGFEMGALAQVGLGDTAAAVETLERGVEMAPDVWINWQLLGNLRSDLGDYENASIAYNSALSCPFVDKSSVMLNQAIMFMRQELFDDALGYLDSVDDPDLQLAVVEMKMEAQFGIGDCDLAVGVGQRALETLTEEAHDSGVVIRIESMMQRIQFAMGEGATSPKPGALASALSNLRSLMRFDDSEACEGSVKSYLFVSENIPPECENKFLLVNDEQDEVSDLDELVFLSSVFMKSDDHEETRHDFHYWWSEAVGGEYRNVLVKEGMGTLQRHRRKTLKQLPLNEWIMNAMFVAYRKGDEGGRKEARNIVLKSEFLDQ